MEIYGTARALTPGRVPQMEPRIRRTINQLLDVIDPSPPFDLVSGLTFRITSFPSLPFFWLS